MGVLTRMTELDAVNQIISTIGEPPVTSLDNAGLSDVAIARSLLDVATRDLQKRAWWFNHEVNYPLMPRDDGQIFLPSNAVSVDTWGPDAGLNLVEKAGQLFDADKHSFIIGRKVIVEITFLLLFNDLPMHAQSYLVEKTSRKFQARTNGVETVDRYQTIDEGRAWSALVAEDARNADLSLYHRGDVMRITGWPRRYR